MVVGVKPTDSHLKYTDIVSSEFQKPMIHSCIVLYRIVYRHSYSGTPSKDSTTK